ncbi:MAG: phosphoglycerate kinase [Alphaproteobacteria bacterium]
MATFRTLDDVDLQGKRVLLRLDINAPMMGGVVQDLTRLEKVVPTLQELSEKGAKTILISHLGRPRGEKDAELSLSQIVGQLKMLTGLTIHFCDETIGEKAEAAVSTVKDGEILVLENLRFDAGETKNDPAFCEALAKLGDVYVNDAFSVSHRAHASTTGIAKLLPAYAGRLMETELSALERVLTTPKKPVVAVIGGAKISTKLDLIGNLTEKADAIIIGGGMANTFLYAQGYSVGKSLCETEMIETAKEIFKIAEKRNCALVLPKDVVVAKQVKEGVETLTCGVDAVPEDQMILDAGPLAIEEYKALIKDAKSIVWNGPLGVFEVAPFDIGTTSVAQYVAAQTKSGALVSVAGGGDTVSALNKAGVTQDYSYISTAGGAFLEWLEGAELPGVAALY